MQGAHPVSGRFAANERWTGILQDQLGEDYYVIEEGLGGRTTNIDHPDPKKSSRNGYKFFFGIFETHRPVDLVVLMIGPNDFKTIFDRSAEETVEVISRYVTETREYCKEKEYQPPRFVLISPAYVNMEAVNKHPENPGIFDQSSADKVSRMPALLKKLAEATGCDFIDAALITHPGEDGLHLDKNSHTVIGQELAKIISEN